MATTFDFTLHLDRKVTEDEADALYGAFDDGSVVTGDGATTIDFTREGPSWAEAQQILRDSDDATRRSLGPLLDYA